MILHAYVTWAAWSKNEFAGQQLYHDVRENGGFITHDKEVTPKLVAKVFRSSKDEKDFGCSDESEVWSPRHGEECGQNLKHTSTLVP